MLSIIWKEKKRKLRIGIVYLEMLDNLGQYACNGILLQGIIDLPNELPSNVTLK